MERNEQLREKFRETHRLQCIQRERHKKYLKNNPTNINYRKWRKIRAKDYDLDPLKILLVLRPKYKEWMPGLSAKQVAVFYLRDRTTGKALEGQFFKILEDLEKAGLVSRQGRPRFQSGRRTTYWFLKEKGEYYVKDVKQL